jgi:hypothetical protein
LLESYLKQNRYPWRYHRSNGLFSTVEKHTVFFGNYCRTTISSSDNAFLIKFGRGNLVFVLEVKDDAFH